MTYRTPPFIKEIIINLKKDQTTISKNKSKEHMSTFKNHNRLTLNFLYLSVINIANKNFKMAQKKFPQLIENYDFYNKLLSERKSIFTEIIEINKCGNNENTLESIEKVTHPIAIEDKMVLLVNVKIDNHDFFQFKLKYKSFLPAPFFRYDSDGETHRNKVDGIGLKDQAIPTPHFHKFNEKGIEIAYKTDKLLNPKESKALEDINLCIAHFFYESNTRLRDDEFPEIKIMADTLGLKMTKQDPHQNMTF